MALQSALNELRNKSSGASRGHSYLTGEGKQKVGLLKKNVPGVHLLDLTS